ncbi:MAG: hypothetical protein ACXVEF_35765, partial [Polyangiales bacterium]
TKGDACGEGACDGKDATKCASFTLEVGGACGAPACAGTSYVAAPTCSATRTCESKPKVECAPYRCAPSGCLKTCASDEGCVDGARCVAGSCVEPVTGARCSDDKLASIAKDGTVTSCAPYRCDTDGACAKSCAASSDCVPGYACDTASGTCAPPEVADSGSGGCTTAPAHGRGRGALAALGLMLLALFARRKHALALVLPVLVGCRSGDAPKSASSTASTLKVGAVSTTTDPNDSAISVSPEVVHTGIACHATGCLLVEPRGPWIVGVRIGLDGKAIDPHGFVIAADTSTDVAVGTDGKDFLVVWARFFRPSAVQRVSGDGKVVGAPIDLVASSTFANFSQVGFDGKTWVVAWREGRSGTATIDVARFATDGTALDPLGATVYDSGLPALADVWPSLACDGSGCTIGTNTKKVIRVVDAKIVGTPVDVDFKIDSASKNGADLVFHGLGTDGERVQAFTSAGVAKGASKLIAPTAIPGVGAIGRVGSDLVVIYRGIADNEIDLARLDATTLAVLETKVASGPLREVRSSQSITAGLVLGSDQSFFRVTTGPLAIARFSPSTRGAAHLYPTSASDGTSHFVAFARQADGKHAVLVSKVDGATFAPASGTTIANETSPVRSVSMAWDGTSYVVSWITDTRVAFARVDAAGTVLDPGGVKVTDVTTAASWCGVRIVPTSTGSLATLLHDDVLGTVRFDKTGKALDAAPQTKTLASIKCESIAAVPAGANVLFAWAGNYDYDSYGYIDSVRIGADGKVIDATPKRISNVHGESFITQLGVVSDGTHLLFGYSIARKGSLGTDVELLRVAADLSDAPVLPWLVSARDPDQESVSLALTGDRAMMAWTENVGSAQELRVSLLDPTAKTVLVDAAKVSTVSASEIQRTVIASFAGSSSLLVDQRSNPDPAFMTERLDVRTVSFDALGGATCAKNDDCELGPCVDGVCCNRACDGACESCNEVGSVGTCVTVAGAPRGSRSCGGAAGCAEATCDGFEPKSCLKFAHAFETKCAEPKCDGALFTSSGYCDGKGSCSVSMTASCAPFKCDPSGCLTSCSSDASCAMGFLCKDGKCVAPEAKATCVDDGLSSQAADGTKKDCAPFRCGTEGTCLKACSSSVDCAPGKSCDTATGACLEPTSADSGGCAFSSTRQPMSFFAMLLAMGLLFRRRR